MVQEGGYKLGVVAMGFRWIYETCYGWRTVCGHDRGAVVVCRRGLSDRVFRGGNMGYDGWMEGLGVGVRRGGCRRGIWNVVEMGRGGCAEWIFRP